MNTTLNNNNNNGSDNIFDDVEYLIILQKSEIDRLKAANKETETKLREAETKFNRLKDLLSKSGLEKEPLIVNAKEYDTSSLHIKSHVRELFQLPKTMSDSKMERIASSTKLDADDCMFSKSVQRLGSYYDPNFDIPFPFPNDVLDMNDDKIDMRKPEFIMQHDLLRSKSNRITCSRDFCGNT
jgi:hypothetical protein